MVSIVLVDHHGVIHEVFAVPECSQKDLCALDKECILHGLTAIIRHTTVLTSAAAACSEIVNLLDTATDEVDVYRSAVTVEDREPAVEVNRYATPMPVPVLTASPTDPARNAPILELDWEG